MATACDGCPPLIMAVCIAALAEKRAAALALVQLLLQAGADVLQRWGGLGGLEGCIACSGVSCGGTCMPSL